MLSQILSLVAVGALWGATNPLIKRATKPAKRKHYQSKIVQFFTELVTTCMNVSYIVPFGLNQLGSVLYFYTLQHADMSLAVPVANSLSFVFTALMGWLLKEKAPNMRTILGVVLVILGTLIQCYEKMSS